MQIENRFCFSIFLFLETSQLQRKVWSRYQSSILGKCYAQPPQRDKLFSFVLLQTCAYFSVRQTVNYFTVCFIKCEVMD